MTTSNLRFDHVLLAIYDLESAAADFEALGFRVFYGGEHSGGWTHNSLILFEDGSYLELIAPTDPALLEDPIGDEGGNYLFLFEKGQGFAGYVLLANDIQAEVAAMRGRGLDIGDPSPGGRLRSDGQELRWQTAFPSGSTSPFLISDDTPRVLRVPDDSKKTEHPNAVTGIREVVVVAADLDAENARYRVLLGREPHRAGENAFEFRMGTFNITLAAAGDDADLQAHREQRGDAPFAIALSTRDPSQVGRLDLESTRGARIDLVGQG